MTKWIVLLRGVNVSGQKKIIMAELRSLLASNDFNNVETYIQSGNIIFEANNSRTQHDVQSRVGDLILAKYGFVVEVFAFQHEWLGEIVAKNPFIGDTTIDTKQLYLTILAKAPSSDNISRLEQVDTFGDEYQINDSVIYLRYPNGAGKAKLTNNLIEAKLVVKATSRNWRTTLKLLELSK